MLPRGLRRAVARAVVEHERLGRERQGSHARRSRAIASSPRTSSSRWEVFTTQYVSSIGPFHPPIVPSVRVHVLDPSAYTPPYDHALCRALGRAGAEVTLVTSRFAYGPVPPADGYVRRELFYRAALGPPGSRVRAASKLAEHVPDMLRYRRLARAADVVHFQWLSVQHLDAHLLPARRRVRRPTRPLVLTAHDVLPREPRAGQLAAQQRLYERFDAIVVHSAHGRARLTGELGVDRACVHVIPHGAFT